MPYADMLNHFRPRETRWTFSQKEYCFTITTIKHLKAGQQIYDSYGKKCNSRFLLNYGFAVEDNADPEGQNHNEVRLLYSLRPQAEDPFYSMRMGLLQDGRKYVGACVEPPLVDACSLCGFVCGCVCLACFLMRMCGGVAVWVQVSWHPCGHVVRLQVDAGGVLLLAIRLRRGAFTCGGSGAGCMPPTPAPAFASSCYSPVVVV